jgi:hypothetical protein
MYVCMYAYNFFSPHNGLTIVNVRIVLFSSLIDNLDILLELLLLLLYKPAYFVFCLCFIVSFFLLVLTL